MYNILVLYRVAESPTRTTILDHLYSFERHLDHRCFYVNLLVEDVPAYVRTTPFDLVVFHTSLLSMRWARAAFTQLTQELAWMKDLPAHKAALPQDEFINTDLLAAFIEALGVDTVFSVAPASEWPKIYAGVDRERVRFHEVLTGYLDDRTVERIDALAKESPARTIDVGYRAWCAEPWLGRHGQLKVAIAHAFEAAAPPRGLTTDLSTRHEDTFWGEAWYRFLLRCRYTIGVEGGASILDADGSVRARTDAYVAAHPGAAFEEVEAACFPGRDGELHLFALSPRHLEACATRTAQVLVEGAYNGVLEPGRHYLPLKADLSDLAEVVERLHDEGLRERLVANAHRDVVASGRYTYRSFVAQVVAHTLAGRPPADPAGAAAALHRANVRRDRASWRKVARRQRTIALVQRLVPEGLLALVRGLRRRGGS